MIVNLLNPIVTHTSKKMMCDEEVVEQYLLTKNIHYFNLLYDRYTNKIYAKCVAMLKVEAKAEDATQEIFIKILLNLSKFTGKSKFSTWIYSITYNYCIDVIRKEVKENTVFVEDQLNIEIADDNCIENEMLEMNVHRLREVLKLMQVEDKSILLMKYQDDMSIKEICDVINKSESAVKMKILRAKERFLKIYRMEFKTSIQMV